MRKQISSLSSILLFWLTNILIVFLLFIMFEMVRYGLVKYHNKLNDIYDTSVKFVFWFEFSILPVAIGTLVIFRKFIRNIKNGQTFTEINIKLLKKFCLGLMVVCLLTFFQKISRYYFVTIPFGGKEGPSWQFNIWLLILALVVSSMTYIFSIGQNLQKEKDLTI